MKKPTVSTSFYLLLACMILTLPLKWLTAAIIAAAFHECCHYGALRLLGGSAGALQLQGAAAKMDVSRLDRGRELLCALAGPTGGFLLLFLLPVFPRIALCGCMQSIYNLLPIYPQDGGRALRCLALLLLPPAYASWLCSFLMWLCIGAMLCLGFYGTFFAQLGILPLLIAAAVSIKAFSTCKAGEMALQ